MRIYNGTAQRQPKAKASAAVTHLIFSGIEHFKYMLPALRRNAGSIILHRNPYVFFFPAIHRNFMFVFPPFYMAQRLTDYILNHLIG